MNSIDYIKIMVAVKDSVYEKNKITQLTTTPMNSIDYIKIMVAVKDAVHEKNKTNQLTTAPMNGNIATFTQVI